MAEKLPTEPYKGVRDFYPEDMAVQQYIFDIWSQTAESFGFQRYDASVLEPSDMYKSKGAENEELVNEQTYTFTDRGGREVTLRPEMTPTVARMIAGKYKELAFPARWYSIPNLFRYERAQRGRVREHWQLNCDMFGSDDMAADVEMIALAHQILINFGASEDMFEVRINDRKEMTAFYESIGITDPEIITNLTRLNDRFHKISTDEYQAELTKLAPEQATQIFQFVSGADDSSNELIKNLQNLGIANVRIDRSLARGFDYYTGVIFEIFDTDTNNNRSMLGGGRYDNLTSLFTKEAIGGIGFGMGDVTMRDFLETHGLLPRLNKTAAVIVIPTESSYNLEAEKVAQSLRRINLAVMVDISNRKLVKKIANADEVGAGYVLVVGEDEVSRNEFVLKNLADGTETSGTLEVLAERFSA